MKIAVIASLIGLTSTSSTCLYCKRADIGSGFLSSYGYCPDADDESCIEDSWNYISKGLKCLSNIKGGWTLDIDSDCKVEEDNDTCKNFAPTED